MVRLASLVQLAPIALSWGAVLPRHIKEYDAIVVGGGPSGLSALSGLARVRRNVLLIDSGEYRNAKTRHIHDLLGFDGVTPAYYRWAAREQLAHYDTVSWINGTVTSITASGNSSYTSFIVSSTSFNNTQETYLARKIVLGTGIRDLLPDTPGLQENWAQGIFWCPWCDGHEHADQSLGLIVPLEEAATTLQEVLTLNTDVIAFVNGTDTPEGRAAATEAFPQWEEYLALHNVKIENRTLASITRLKDGSDAYKYADPSLPTVPEYDLFRVDFTEGEPVERAAFLVSFPKEQRSRVGADLGVTLYGERLYANQSNGMLTNVPGVYAVGDANTDNSTNLPHALWSGKRAAVNLHVRSSRPNCSTPQGTLNQLEHPVTNELLRAVKLEKEDGLKDLGQLAKRSAHGLDARSLWEIMNDEPGQALYAGELDQ
ncbi:Pyridine nucleotide-disulfide oxidoreductase class-2 [Macrophomina phaseolina MS6]|uniref:Pyridine nucleotide-disulfide oxidoreductase class-2 n=1 Tax=Macrophomina phaseolina (strain MS6) TaxID=1126212 RepID=K2RXK1_MACPH|nr:Pyridine nucleotide-disulfide oxidoreductase class-2 [Macrophomina phaseolina MS6]